MGAIGSFAVSGSGDLVGPGTSTDNAIARFDGTAGKTIQGSLGILDDAGFLTLPVGGGLNAGGVIVTLASGRVGINTLSPTATLHLISSAAGDVGFIIKASPAQTANLTQWQNSSASVLACVTAAGKFGIGTSSPTDSLHIVNASTAAARIETTSDAASAGFAFKKPSTLWTVGNGVQDASQHFNIAGGGIFLAFNLNGAAAFGNNPTVDSANRVNIETASASVVGLAIKGFSAQSANLQEWQNSSAVVMTFVAADGTISSHGSGSNSEHFGELSSSSGTDSAAFGRFARAVGQQSIAIGVASIASDIYAVAIGGFSGATASGAFALGSSSSASGINSTTIGTLSSVTGTEAACMGTLATVTANYSLAIGHSAMVSHAGSMALGHSATSTAAGQLMLGSSAYPISQIVVASANPKFKMEAATNVFIIQGATSQSANLQEWQNSSNAVLLSVAAAGHLTFGEAVNAIFGTATGTKLGTGASQKLSFWNAAPIVQPTTAIAAATFVTNTSGTLNDSATWDGYTIGQVVKALRNAGLLA